MPFLRKYTGPLKTAVRKQLSAIAIAVDAYFNYVTLLLQGDGTNGAQNNTFLDSSSNAFSITRNGNTTQGSFSPYGTLWSNFFDGVAGSKLSAANNAAFALGSGNFTVECWFWVDNLTTAMCMFENRPSNTALGINMFINYDAPGQVQYRDSSGAPISSSITVTAGSWNHYALVRSGSTITLWINGQSGGTVTRTTNFTNTTCVLAQDQGGGFNYKGYLSNFRMVVGTAVYTSSFTPSTTPLTAISGTSLLTSQSNQFIDNSANNFAMTSAGTVSVQRFNPFGTATAYSTSVIGGSGYFDGSGDYLSAGSNSAFAVGTGDFTFQAWVYPTAWQSPVSAIFETGTSVTASRFAVVIYDGGLVKIDSNANLLTSSISLVRNQWTFISVIRSSGTMTMYFNGTSVASGSVTANFSQTQGDIGKTVDNYYYPGYITDLRLVKGTALSNTVPTAPLANVSNTSLLTNYTNGAIFDNAMMNDLETVGNAQISTSVVKYGTGSMYFDGASWEKIPNSQNFNFGSGNFTVEGWVYCTYTTPRQDIFTTPTTSGGYCGLSFGIYNGNFELTMSWTGSWDILFATAGSVSANTWYHFAIVRNGGTVTVYINGTSTYTNTGLSTSSLVFGTDVATISYGRANQSDARYLYGYIDDFRITKGYARYTTTFTPPNQALPTFQTY